MPRFALLGALVALVGAACAPRAASPDPVADTPTLDLLAACTTYAACVRSHEAAQAYYARCNHCDEGRSTVISVRSKLDSLYLEELRRGRR